MAPCVARAKQKGARRGRALRRGRECVVSSWVFRFSRALSLRAVTQHDTPHARANATEMYHGHIIAAARA